MIRRGSRWIARLLLLSLMLFSAASFWWAAERIRQDPLLRPLIERSSDEFAAALERELAKSETGPGLEARLAVLLAEDPRNWIAIDAVTELAGLQNIALSPELNLGLETAREEDSGYLATAGACVMCFWDASSCSLSQALLCNAPVQMTPIGDLAGLSKAGISYVSGAEIDQLDLALSAIGLGATAAALSTGGTSLSVKAGAGLLKMARKMALIPPRLLNFLTDTARRGLRWDELARIDSLTDPARLLRPEVIRPAADLASDLGRISGRLAPSETLHLLRYIDGPGDARRLANASETLGRKALGTLEVIGKSRFMRAALRFGDEALALAAGLAGLLVSLASAIGAGLQSVLARGLRQALRAISR